jgi:BioD-like phosphotransacetylase family protein
MKSLYITSLERYSGKTAVCLALGKHFQNAGYKIGYLKPLSIQPRLTGGKIVDEDAAFVKDMLNLDLPLADLSPIVVTHDLLKARLTGSGGGDLMPKVEEALRAAAAGKNLMLIEGGGSLREGYAVDLPTPQVIRALKSRVLSVVKYRDEIRLMDDVLTAATRLEEFMCGAIINRVPPHEIEFVKNFAKPYIEKQGIRIFGILPEEKSLAALMVDDLIDALHPEVLTDCDTSDIKVENLTVGAMTAEVALGRLRVKHNAALITGGDRSDIQIVALEVPVSCMILTGGLEPRPLIIRQANAQGVPILLMRTNTLETVEAIDNIFGKTRIGQLAKLEQFQQLLSRHVDMEAMIRCLDL